MFSLYKYELKKIFSQKYFTIAFLVLYVFVMAVSVTPMITGSINSIKSKQEISNRLLDDSLFEEFYSNREDDKYHDVNDFIKYCTNSEKFDDLSANEIYGKRLEQLSREFKTDNLNEGEIKYWLEKENELNKPFVYQADDAYSEIYEVVYVINFVVLVLVALAITGIFADEKATGADQILLSSKYGRNKLFTAKVLSSLTVGFIITTVMYASIVGINLFVYGSDGFDAGLQIHMPTCLYSISIGTSVLIMYGQLLFASLVYVCFSLLLSIATNNHPASSGVMIVMMFLSMFNIPAKYRVISQIWDTIPSGHIGSWSLKKYQLIKVFGTYFNSLEYTTIIWPLMAIIFIVIAKMLYNKYQVEGR